MIYRISYLTYILSLLFASAVSLRRYKALDMASKIISILLCCDLLSEAAAYFFKLRYHNNLPVYAVDEIVEYALLCLYFNYATDIFRRTRSGIFLAIGGVAAGILNLIFLQGPNTLTSYFLFMEGLLMIGMSLFALLRLLLDPDLPFLSRHPHFWFICIIAFFWSITFLDWGLYDYIDIQFHAMITWVNEAMSLIGIVTYGSFGLVFLRYPKLKQA
jgi:hypothetical protein